MPIYSYDIECLKNLFTATFVNVADEKEVHVFYIGFDKIDYSDLLKFLNQKMTLVGFNNHSYDDPMLRFIVGYKGTKILPALHELSSKLVSDLFRDDKNILALRYPRNIQYSWDSVDLMRIMAFDKLGVSLKQTAINLRWHKIQDMPIDHNSTVRKEDLELILSYNLNDVLITKRLYEEITPLRELREELSSIYHVDLRSASDSRIANLIFEHIYADELHADIRALKDMRTTREKVLLGDCIAKFVEFKNPELQDLLDRISVRIAYRYNGYRYTETITFANCNFSFGIGGLHTEDAPGVFNSTEDSTIQDMDVASYYPNLIINNNFYPQHLGENFIKVLKKITSERLAAKKAGNKVKADGLKITINSVFGKMGFEYYWLLDAKQMLSTTLSGQLGLMMLVEDLYLNGIEVLSCNTDGIVCRIPKNLEDKYYEVAKRWQEKTNLELEYTPYVKYVRRDVNSYITVKKNGATKEKGAFLKEVDLKKAYHMPIVAKALYEYFINSVPVRDTLEKSTDIMDFCISQKSGSDFRIELHTIKGVEHLQKTNRFYISTNGGALIKRNVISKKTIGLYVNRTVRILNDYDTSVPFDTYKIDYSFYEKEVMKMVDEIEPKQLKLFDVSSVGVSNKTKMTARTPKVDVEVDEKNIIRTLNKLGKNQLSSRLDAIVANSETIEEISNRYTYVMDFDHRTMEIKSYCLAKGTIHTFVISKDAYKKQAIEKGQLVYCNKFVTVDGQYVLMEYTVTEKFMENKDKLL